MSGGSASMQGAPRALPDLDPSEFGYPRLLTPCVGVQSGAAAPCCCVWRLGPEEAVNGGSLHTGKKRLHPLLE